MKLASIAGVLVALAAAAQAEGPQTVVVTGSIAERAQQDAPYAIGSVVVNEANGRYYEAASPRAWLLSARLVHAF